jgi:4-hydroxy-2-oxoheptanedioate aldolase
MMIKQGFGMIVATFDVWGLAQLVHGQIKKGRDAAKQIAEEASAEKTNGETKVPIHGTS